MQFVGENLARAVKEIEAFGLSVPDCTVIEITDVDTNGVHNLYRWCREQDHPSLFSYTLVPTKEVQFRSSAENRFTARYYFTDPAMAMAFKLRWA